MTQNAVRWSMVAGTAWLVGIAIGLVLQFAFVTFLRASGGDFVATLLSNLVFDLLLLLLAVRLLRRPTRTVLVVSLALALLSAVGPGWSPPGFEAWTWLSWLGAGIAGLASLAALIIARRGQLSSAPEERPR
jgi:hypothetical protein